jgi:hypothetical protein
MTQLLSPELQSRIELLRAKALAGTLSLDEQREAIRMLRADRVAAAARGRASRAKPTPRDASTLLGGLGIKLE